MFTHFIVIMHKIEVQSSNQASPTQIDSLKHCNHQFYSVSSSKENENEQLIHGDKKHCNPLSGSKSDGNDLSQRPSEITAKGEKRTDIKHSRNMKINFTTIANDSKFYLDPSSKFTLDRDEKKSTVIGNPSVSASSPTYLLSNHNKELNTGSSSIKSEVFAHYSSIEEHRINCDGYKEGFDIGPKDEYSRLGKRNFGNKLSTSSPDIRTVSLNSLKDPRSFMSSSASVLSLRTKKHECNGSTNLNKTKKSKQSSYVSSKYMLQRKPPKSPFEEYLNFLAESGYYCRAIPSLEIKDFFHQPTKRDTEAYDKESISAIRAQDIPKLKEMYESGKSMQCCNSFGESLIHMACRRGYTEVIRFLISRAKVSIRVRDDFGRTPLHDACWTPEPNFELMDLLIAKDSDLLLISDKRGHTPLQYVRKEHWGKWKEFLKSRRKLLFPKHFTGN